MSGVNYLNASIDDTLIDRLRWFPSQISRRWLCISYVIKRVHTIKSVTNYLLNLKPLWAAWYLL